MPRRPMESPQTTTQSRCRLTVISGWAVIAATSFPSARLNDVGQRFACHRCRCERMDPAGGPLPLVLQVIVGLVKSSDSINNAAPAILCHIRQGIVGTHYFSGHDHHGTAPSVSRTILRDGRLHARLSGGEMAIHLGFQQQEHYESKPSDRWSGLSVDESCYRSGQLRRLLKRLAFNQA